MAGSNTIRFTGLASGMDTEALVKAMLMNQKNKIDKQTKVQQKNTWKQEAWKEMNKKLADFQSKYVDKLRTQGFFAQNKVLTSNDSAIYVNPNTNIPQGTHEIKVTKLATGANLVTSKVNSSGKDKNGNPVKSTTKLSDLNIDIEDLLDLKIIMGAKVADIEGADEPKSIDLRTALERNSSTIDENSSIKDLVSALKNLKFEDSDFGLNVNYDEGNQMFFISSKNTGADSSFKFEGKNKVLAQLGFLRTVESGREGEVGETKAIGTDAGYTYNGIDLKSSTNKVNVNGMEITLKAETSQPVTIQAQKDTEGIIKFVKEFIKDYNDLMKDLDEKLTTKTKRSYEPLTDEEKEKMTDKQIEKIENYVKSGLFYRDESLMAVRDTLRDTMGSVVKGTSSVNGICKYNSLSSIGITTGDWREQGKLYLDEEGEKKLKKALEENPEDVMKIFAGSSDDPEYTGVFTRIYDKMYGTRGSLSSSLDEVRSFGSFYNDKLLTKEMKDITERIDTLNKKYTEQETRLYKKFTAMEKMISQLNSQQSYLTSMMAQ